MRCFLTSGLWLFRNGRLKPARAFGLSVLGFAALLISAGGDGKAQDRDPPDIRIGVLAFSGAEKALREFEPTRRHIEASLKRPTSLAPFDLDGLRNVVATRAVDFIITNPGDYIGLEARFGATRIATLETRRGKASLETVGSTVVALRKAGAPAALADLKGRRLAAVSRQAFGGYSILWREMEDAGLSPAGLDDVVETGFPMQQVVAALREGRADVGVLRACLLEDMIAEGAVHNDEFIVVGERPAPDFPCRVSSRLYPDWPFARLNDTPRDLAKSVAAALLAMPEREDHAWTAPLDYSSVHALYQQLKLGPYANLGGPTLADIARRYWGWLAAAGMAIVWWIAHVARVEMLVRRRTAELTREIAEREKAEKDARLHREQRDQFSRLGILGEMASNIAHELNQPLAAIGNYAEGMSRMLSNGRANSALLADGAHAISEQARRAAGIIQRIRAFVRRREARRELVDPNDLARETVALFEGLAGRRGVKLYVHLVDDPPRVMADKIEIEQVLLNLLQNAGAARVGADMTAGGVTLRISREGERVRIAVRDAGPGLTPEIEAHLFETFFTTKPQGLGLGLSICRTIVESHGGRLWAANNEDGGATLRFTLPIAENKA